LVGKLNKTITIINKQLKAIIMRTMKFLTYATFVLFLGLAISSCSGDDGADGADGATGSVGATGTNGTDGADGTDGSDGSDGTDGLDGVDGNANVQTYFYDNPAWGGGSGMDIDMTGILTTEVVENDVILSYIKNTGSTEVYAIPGWVWIGTGYRQYAAFVNAIPIFRIVSLELNGSFTSNANLVDADWVKIIIIESTNTTTGRVANPQQAVYNELEMANVDVNDYYAVCAYYGINPE